MDASPKQWHSPNSMTAQWLFDCAFNLPACHITSATHCSPSEFANERGTRCRHLLSPLPWRCPSRCWFLGDLFAENVRRTGASTKHKFSLAVVVDFNFCLQTTDAALIACVACLLLSISKLPKHFSCVCLLLLLFLFVKFVQIMLSS